MKKYFPPFALALSFCFLLPHLALGIGENNPEGVAGNYNGAVTTAGSIDPYTGNARRVVDDIVVPGSLGAYPLKWSRIHNTRSSSFSAFGQGGSWGHSYDWGLWVRRPEPPCCYYPNPYEGPDGMISFPDGREIPLRADNGTFVIDNWSEPSGSLQEIEDGNFNFTLPDGGRIEFRHPPGSTSGHDLIPTAIVDPYGQRTTYERDAQGRLSRIVEPGGRYLLITYEVIPYYLDWPVHAWQYVTVIKKVEAFDRQGGSVTQSVTYNYQGVIVGQTFHLHHWLLMGADYSDGTHASYTYQASNLPERYPAIYRNLLSTCDDVRFAGPMKRIRYDYMPPTTPIFNGNVAWGQVRSEKTFDGQTTVSEIIYPAFSFPPNPQLYNKRTEKRADGSTRLFDYNATIYSTELQSYTDFGNPGPGTNTSRIHYAGGPGADYYKVFTDARGKVTTVGKENVAGAVLFVQRGDGPPVVNHYTDAANPYYLDWKTDERGNTTRYIRYPADHPHYPNAIQFINYPDGGQEEFTYNDFGQVLTHRMTSGGTENFLYDTRGRKTHYWPPPTCDTIACSDPDPQNHPTRYFYYEEGPNTDRLRFVEDPLRHSTWYQYNLRGQVTKVTYQNGKYTESGYNPLPDGTRTGPDGTLAWTEDELRHRTTSWYDEYSRVIKLSNPLGKETLNDYTPLRGGLSPLSHTTSSVYRMTSPLGKITESDYDWNFRRIRTTQAPGTNDEATTTFTYDPVGNLETTTEPNHQQDGLHTTFVYDDRNRQTTVTDALGHATITAYDDANNKTSIQRADGYSIRFTLYDKMNRLKEHFDERNYRSTMDYDYAGNLRSQTDERGKVYSYTYDALKRKTRMTYPDTKHEDFLYDGAGNLLTYTNRTGAVQTFTYDVRNRPERFSWNDHLTQWQETDYDDASRVTEIRTGAADTPQTQTQTTVHHTYYDDNRLWTEAEWTSLGNNIHRTVTYTYDDDGNRQSIQYPGGTSFTYEYTLRSQPRKINAAGEPIVIYGYDPNGNITNVTRDNWTTTVQTPDYVNRITSITHNLAGATKRFEYAYNEVNNIKAVRRDGGLGDGFAYDESRQIKGFKREAQFTAWPPPTFNDLANPANNMSIGFDGCGNRTTVGNSNPAPGSYPFNNYSVNDLNQYSAINGASAPGPTPTPPPGPTPPPTPPPGPTPTPPPGPTPTPPSTTPTPPNVTPTPPSTPSPTPPPGQVVPVVISDDGNFGGTVHVTMTGATEGARIFYKMSDIQPVTPTHDQNGNPTNGTAEYFAPLSVPDGQHKYFRAIGYKAGMIDSAPRDWEVDNTTGGGNAPDPGPGKTAPSGPSAPPPTYDPNGNLTSYKGWTYTYDAQNRLVRVSGTYTVLFYYDGRNRQIARSINGVVRFSVWDDWELVEEYSSSNVRTAAYLQGAHGIIKSLLNNVYYYQDSLGSTTHVANASGALLEFYRYDLYGTPAHFRADNTSIPASKNGVTDLYAGERWVSELGLYDLRNRFMSPELGRFLQADPIGFKGDASNLYRYCGGDPVNRTDPMGLAPIEISADVDFLARKAAVTAQQVAKGGLESNIAVFRDRATGRLSLSEPRPGWKDPKSGLLRSQPYDPPAGASRPASSHNHPNGSPLSWLDRIAGDFRGEAVYSRGDGTERWLPDESPNKQRLHIGGRHESWNARTRKWDWELTPKIPQGTKFDDRGAVIGQGSSMGSGGDSLRELNTTQLVIDSINGNNAGEGVHPRGPR